MTLLKLFLIIAFIAVMAVLDVKRKLPLFGRLGGVIEISLLPHCCLIVYLIIKLMDFSGAAAVWAGILCGGFMLVRIVVMSIKPHNRKLRVKVRVKALYGGKVLIGYSAWSALLQTVFYIVMGVNGFFGLPRGLVIADTVTAVLLVLGFALNGIIRVLVLCYRLNIIKRIVVFLLLPIPVVNIFVLRYMYKIADEEYAFEDTRVECDEQRAESQVCCTKYPLLLVHGIGFRDRRYFNYWGRIPKELKRNGAAVYYGMQDGCITVEAAGEQIKKRILEVIDETGCEKVNIIAHSKGGLDARYVISTLGMDDYVASLTTVGTPHRGSQVADEAQKLPDSLYRKVAAYMDRSFRKLGDENPDFYNACHEFTSEYAEKFNRENPDSGKVYYQSYTSVMSGMFSFGILAFTYLILRKYGRNDGLVTVESAKWGEFRKVYEPVRHRGVSHGDTIDLMREDFSGFDPREAYVEIVSDLKEKGF